MLALANFFINNTKFTFVVSAFVIIFGVMGILKLKSESYPAVDFASATITTSYDGASAEDVETKITKPIEDELRTVSGVKDIRSISQAGKSSIVVRAELDGPDTAEVMSELQRSVDRVTNLPADLKDPPKFVELKSSEFPVVELAVVGSNNRRARDKVVDLLKEEVEDNKLVLSVRKVGFRKRSFLVDINLEKLSRFHIGIDEIERQIAIRNVNTPGGKLEQSSNQKLVRVEGKVGDKADIENIVLRANYSGKIIRLKDVASVFDDQESAKVLTKYNGEEATLVIVTKKAGADTIELVDDIEKKVEQFASKYSEQFKFDIYNNEAIRVRKKLGILSSNAVSGLVLVMFFLLLFLPFRIGLVASMSLPLAVMATVGFMPVMDMNLNAITILALVIALGMLVDNSVVISENYARLRGEGQLPLDAARNSIAQLWIPITATVMTTIAAFLPMLVTKGIMGKFIMYIPIIVTVSLLVSLGESFFLLPMRLIGLDKLKKQTSKQSKVGWFDRFANSFEKFVRTSIRYRYLTLFVFTILLIGSGVMMTVFNKVVLFPAEQVETYIARVELEKGSTLDQTNIELTKVAAAIKQKTGASSKSLVARAGTNQVGPMDPKGKSGDNVGMITIMVDEETKNSVSDTEFLAKLREIKSEAPVNSMTFEAMANGPPVGEAVNATFRSNSKESLETVVSQVLEILNTTDGVRDARVDDVFEDDKVYVRIDYKKAAMLGLNVQSVGRAIRTAISGKVASSVNLDNEDIDIRIRLDRQQRLSGDNLKVLQILDPRGNLIPLSKFATLERVDGTPQIKRFDFKRSKTVTAGIVETKLNAIAANKIVEERFESLRADYPEVSLVFGGEAESTKESMESLGDALVLSLIAIFALLVLLFNSFLMPLIIMTTIPLGLVGFSIAFALHGKPISFLAMIGVIGLGGIIVNSGIILISFIEELRADPKTSLEDALAKASKLRLRAVVVSSLTTISGLLPTAYGIGGSDAMLMPMTLAMAWGLTSGTILTLVWVPSAYAILEDVSSFFARIFGRKTIDVEPGESQGPEASDRPRVASL